MNSALKDAKLVTLVNKLEKERRREGEKERRREGERERRREAW